MSAAIPSGLQAVHDSLTCGVVLCGAGGRVLEANRAAADLLQLTREQLLGRAPLDADWYAVDAGGRPLAVRSPVAALAHDPPRRFHFGVGRAAHEPLTWVRGDSARVAVPRKPYQVVCTLVDVTCMRDPGCVEPALAETHATRRLERLHAVRSAAMAINASHDLRVTLDVIARQAALQLGVSAAAVGLLDEETGLLEYVAGVGFRRSAILRRQVAAGEAYLGPAAAERRPFLVDDPASATWEVGRRLAGEEGFVAHLAVPLVVRGRVAGGLELFHRHRLRPDDEWWEFVETMAEQAATAVDAHRLRLRLGPTEVAACPLSAVEQQVLRLVASGCSNRAIAQQVFLSENTVKFHLRRVYRQLGVHTRTEAVLAATVRGWI